MKNSDPDVSILDDSATLAHLGATRLELGFDQRHHVARAREQFLKDREQSRSRDEREVGDDQVEHDAGKLLAQHADIGPFHRDHARVGQELLVELSMSDIDRVNGCGASLQEAIGEAAG